MSIEVAGYTLVSLFAVGGILSVAAAAGDWDWFFRSESVKLLTWRLSRPWQRAVYAIIGMCILAMAAEIFTEITKIA